MKKLFSILVLMSCGFLYAETKTYKVTDSFDFSLKEPKEFNDIYSCIVNAVYPCESSFIIKLDNFEFYVDKDLVFYMTEKTWSKEYGLTLIVYKCNVTKLYPNGFEINKTQIKTIPY